jgi:hypothetical protein
MQRVDLLEAAKAALSKNASALQKRAISSRVSRTSGLVKDRITYELNHDELDARIMRLLTRETGTHEDLGTLVASLLD